MFKIKLESKTVKLVLCYSSLCTKLQNGIHTENWCAYVQEIVSHQANVYQTDLDSHHSGTGSAINQSLIPIIQYSSTVYRYRAGLGFLAPKYQLNIYFVTSKQNWLGTAKPKNVFISTINPSAKLI